MMKSIYPIFIIIMAFIGCQTNEKVVKNISCPDNVILQYDKSDSNKSDPIIKDDADFFTVYFINGYNDNILAFVNNKLQFEKYLKIDDSTDGLNEYFGYNYSKDKTVPILKIVSTTKNNCFDIPIDKKYKIIYVFFNPEGKWVVRFSNSYYLR